ncbi:hypothetical protein JTB14_012262 [Gonioctena quinquepunctata]|nr:hypothetical protein JTB14_012262 [Gonioctena quinquepunctata]
MSDPRLCNFQSCCRLCLTERLDTLKSIFDETVEDQALSLKIFQFVGVEINSSDKLSTQICPECIIKVSSFHSYKEECVQNQIKLQEWLTSSQTVNTNGLADTSFQIKEEPADETDSIPDGPESRVEMVQVKNEPMDQNEETMEEVYNELPPPLTPHPLEAANHEQLQNGDARLADQEETTNSQESQPDKDSCDGADQQKILFAAGLKLLQKDSTPISCESLSKIELSYIEKCKAMVNMHKSLICACHNVPHQNLKGLLSHLRALRIWFPVFTCYNCMITFTDRSTFTRHIVRCPSQSLDTITKLSNLRKRSEVKTRLYQNFKCTICKFMFSFHEDFCRHVDEEHASLAFPFHCQCRRVFDNMEDYKDHVYVSCMVDYYCDICFITTKTLDDFQKHACEVHDNSEGFILLQDDNYKMRKPAWHTASREEVDESVILTGKRERRASVKAPIIENDLEEVPLKVINPVILSPKSNNRKCPVCAKEYSSYKNMMRHYKVHQNSEKLEHFKEEEGDDEEEEEGSFYSCPDCGGMYNTVEWQNHLLEKHESKSCGDCGKFFQFQSELEQHRSVHLNLKVYRDSKTQSYKSTVISPGSDEELMLACEVCDLLVPTREALEEHKLTHGNQSTNDEKMRKCVLCDKEFATYSGLWEHNKKMHPERKTPASNSYPKQCTHCDKVCTTGAAYHRHKQIHEKVENRTPIVKGKKNDSSAEEESYHTCKRCFKVFSSKYNLKNHMKCHGINSSPPIKKVLRKPNCNVCQQVFDTIEEVTRHKEELHNDTEMPLLSNQTEGEEVPFVFTCDVCVMTFSTKMALKKHKEKHLQESKSASQKQSVFCKYCKIPFDSIISLTKHMHLEHDEGGKPKIGKLKEKEDFACSICKKSFQTAAALTTHIGWHKRSQNEMNTKLMRQTKVVNKLTPSAQIKQEPADEPKFQCATCLAELPNDTALQVHILEKHRSVSAIMLIPRCNTCNKDFTTQDEYETHKRLHDFLERQKQHEQNMLLQQQAQAVPTKKAEQQNPLPTKAPIIPGSPPKIAKNFPCKYCNAGFSRSDTLGAHVRQYHKEFVQTEFKCTQCDRIFDKQNSLTIHLKVHEKQKVVVSPASKPLFSCSICNMGFDLPKDLRAHTINAHPF